MTNYTLTVNFGGQASSEPFTVQQNRMWQGVLDAFGGGPAFYVQILDIVVPFQLRADWVDEQGNTGYLSFALTQAQMDMWAAAKNALDGTGLSPEIAVATIQ